MGEGGRGGVAGAVGLSPLEPIIHYYPSYSRLTHREESQHNSSRHSLGTEQLQRALDSFSPLTLGQRPRDGTPGHFFDIGTRSEHWLQHEADKLAW